MPYVQQMMMDKNTKCFYQISANYIIT